MDPWLTVVGIGDGGLATLTDEQSAALRNAEHVFGGRRHLAMLEAGMAGTRIAWASPFAASQPLLEAARGRPTVIVATGDPSWFGPLAWLRSFLPDGEMRVLPAPSAFSLAAARLGWPLETVRCLSAHGRPVADLAPAMLDGQRLMILSSDGSTPHAIAELLSLEGLGDSRLTVCEHLGGPRERILDMQAASMPDGSFAALNLVAVACRGAGGQGLFGLPDTAFLHDGKMTKRPLRALALAALRARPGALLWDIGAGCGSIAVEWCRLGGRALAIEPRDDRRAMLARNAERLAGPGLEIVAGMAPDVLDDLPAPDAVFIGGGLSPQTFERAYAALKAGGDLAAHAVTLESEAQLLAIHARLGGELLRIAGCTASPVGSLTGWRPHMPVTHLHLTKPWGRP